MNLALLMLVAQLDAAPPPSSKLELKLGEQTRPPIKATAVSCGNLSVVQTVQIDGRFELKAVGAGATRCTFTIGKGAAKVVEISVRK